MPKVRKESRKHRQGRPSNEEMKIRRSRRHRHVHFQATQPIIAGFDSSAEREGVVDVKQYRTSAVRSLFPKKSLHQLPDEVVSMILSYLGVKSLMQIRPVCSKLRDLVDHNKTLWSTVSFQDLWPKSSNDTEDAVFSRGVAAGNVECLVKLGLTCLYHYNLTTGTIKTEELTAEKALRAAVYFRDLDQRLASMATNTSRTRPVTWMLIRPPWANFHSVCLKQAIYNKLNENKDSPANGVSRYNLGQVMKFVPVEHECNSEEIAARNFAKASSEGMVHATYELLVEQRNAHKSHDNGTQLKWLRDLRDCAVAGSRDAAFELCRQYARPPTSGVVRDPKADQSTAFVRSVFADCRPSRIDLLEQKYQPKINGLMRCILVDWLGEVAYMKDMSNSVLQASVALVDRYLKIRVVDRNKLQLLGITCLLVAAKTCASTARQVHILTVRESSWLTDSTYSYEDVVKMMGEVIGALRGDLWNSTPCDYLELLFLFASLTEKQQAFAHYVNDMALQYISCGIYKPSVIACSVVMLTRIFFNESVWSKKLSEVTGFEVKDLADCLALLFHKCFVIPPCHDDRDIPLKSIKEEYLTEARFNVASLAFPSLSDVSSTIVAASDRTLVCSSLEPLTFTQVSSLNDVDESHSCGATTGHDDTLNVSIRSVDYDGDSEELLNSSDTDLEDSFCVGRSRYPSVLSDFSDDETTMENEACFNDHGLDQSFRENLTPMLPTLGDKLGLNASSNIEDSAVTKNLVAASQTSDVFLAEDIDCPPNDLENECPLVTTLCDEDNTTETVTEKFFRSYIPVSKRTTSHSVTVEQPHADFSQPLVDTKLRPRRNQQK